MSNNKSHFQKTHLLVLFPIFAMISTPLIPFVNNGGFHFGIPNVCLWVMSWAVITTLILAYLFKMEPELDEEISEILGNREEDTLAKKEVM